jgi:outer membrane protein assembly factor BamB
LLFPLHVKIKEGEPYNLLVVRLFFGNENCEFYAINISTGKKLWMYSTDAAVETWPVIADRKIFFNAENTLYILDCITGNEIYKVTYPSKNSIRASKNAWTFNDSYVAVSDGAAYYLNLDGELVAVDISKGSIMWTLPSESPGVVSSGINYDDGKLYYADNSGYMCCVGIETRQLNFRTYIGDKIYAPIHINNGRLYGGGRSTKIYCIDGNSGEVLWATHSYNKTTWFSGGSVSIGNTLYTGTSDEHAIVSINKETGELLHLFPTESNVYTQPVLNGENIILISTFRNSYIMEYDTRSNEKVWQGQVKENVFSSPSIYKGVLYFGSDSGKIYSIKLK